MSKSNQIVAGCLLLLCGAAQGVLAGPSKTVPNTVVVDSCSWNRPGHNPFMGEVVAAVDRYVDIPQDVRERLKARMAKRDYDEVVSIRRDAIEGRATYDPVITDMHFGVNRLCRSVDRSGWADAMHERGLVYCEGSHCILVPTVCRNVSRITRRAAAAPTAGAGAGTPVITSSAQNDDPLVFDPPGAGGSADEVLPLTAGGSTPLSVEPVPTEPMSGPLSTPPWSFSGGPDGRARVAALPGSGGGGGGGGGGWGGGTPTRPAPGPGPGPGMGPGPAAPVTAVPEPASTLLMGLGLAALVVWTRRRQAVAARS